MDMFKLAIYIWIGATNFSFANEPQPVQIVKTESSGVYKNNLASNVSDGKISDASRWIGSSDQQGEIWIELQLAEETKLAGMHIYSGYEGKGPIEAFRIQFRNAYSQWEDIPSAHILNNRKTALAVEFDTTIEVDTDALRLVVEKTKNDLARIKELVVWPDFGERVPALAMPTKDEAVKASKIYLNQSGFNLGKPKRFTAPTLPDGTPFRLVNTTTGNIAYEGKIQDHLGDFSDFNPETTDSFVVTAGGETSFPFRIGHWWLERVTYQNAVNFMIDSRHYFGDYKEKCRGSFGWRDDHFFGWELNTLVPQYLSNPSAYDRMPSQITYEQKEEFNGALEAYNPNAPDIIKLIHFGADVIVTQELDHEMLKQQLAFFLYAWPYIKEWLPEQNYRVVSNFAFSYWDIPTITKKRFSKHNKSKEHNLLALKTKIGSTKGENPPGHTVLPNLLMYEVAKRENRADADKYFQAAYNQVDWMIRHLDWNDPLTTKGQRVSEHLTIPGMALMLSAYGDRAPNGLREKIEEWKEIALTRSENMWDFRQLSEDQWVPTGPKRTMWNEPGNVLGFPAIAIAAIQATPNSPLNQRLTELAYAHMDNAFGRNPTGRHFSYDGAREIEGVDLGWFSYHKGGIGMLAETRFVFDGSPKNEHYPFNPEVRDVGWVEGWVQFNTAFNLSLAYLAFSDIEISVVSGYEDYTIRLKAPLNFDYEKIEYATAQVTRGNNVEPLVLTEEGENSAWFSASLPKSSYIDKVSYGYGYFAKEVWLD